MSLSLTSTLLICFVMFPDMDKNPSGPEVDLNEKIESPVAPQQWLSSYDEAQKAAARNNLPLLLHFDASWCAACRRMDAQVLNKPEVTSQLGVKFVGVRIDADRYKHLIREYGISTLPTEVVVQPDGSRGQKMVGSVALSTYVSRLSRIAAAQNIARSDSKTEPEDTKSVRSCLIVKHDGKMVGMGGYSPVALISDKKWKRGSDRYVATHEGVEYFLQSQEEVVQFNASPQKFIPGMHGCDLVELQLENRATTGAIEYGAFYQGKIFFFASLENRVRFENNPTWYLNAMTDARTANDEQFPFLSRDVSSDGTNGQDAG